MAVDICAHQVKEMRFKITGDNDEYLDIILVDTNGSESVIEVFFGPIFDWNQFKKDFEEELENHD